MPQPEHTTPTGNLEQTFIKDHMSDIEILRKPLQIILFMLGYIFEYRLTESLYIFTVRSIIKQD